MSDKSYYDGTATSLDEVPDEAKDKLAPLIVERFGDGTGSLFDEMREALPNTWQALVDGYSAPMIGWVRVPPAPHIPHFEPDVLVDLLLRGEERMLRVQMNHSREHTQERLDHYYDMLPPGIRQYYFLADAFQFFDGISSPSWVWHGLPLAAGCRQSSREYVGGKRRTIITVPRAAIRGRMFVWMTSEDGQLLLVDEAKGDMSQWDWRSRKKPLPIDDPVGYWDAHCAKVLESGDPTGPLF